MCIYVVKVVEKDSVCCQAGGVARRGELRRSGRDAAVRITDGKPGRGREREG